MSEDKPCTQQTVDEDCNDCNYKDMCEPETIANNGIALKEATHLALWVPLDMTVSELAIMGHAIGCRMSVSHDKDTMRMVMSRDSQKEPISEGRE